jgi:Fe-S-cluster containining protein
MIFIIYLKLVQDLNKFFFLVKTINKFNILKCRDLCGACCIAPSISSSIPGMPNGKPAGVVCVHLDENF